MRFTTLSPSSLHAAIGRRRCQRIAARLVPFSENRLAQSEREAISAHLSRCVECRAELEAIESVRIALASHAASSPAPFSVDLWTRIEAEIRPENANADWGTPSARRRRVFGIDPSWPNSIPVGVAIASAVVFAVFLVNSRHGLIPGTGSSATMTAGIAPTSINLSIRPTPSAEVAEATPSAYGMKARVPVVQLEKPAAALAEARSIPTNDGSHDPFAPAAARHVMSAPAMPVSHTAVLPSANNATAHATAAFKEVSNSVAVVASPTPTVESGLKPAIVADSGLIAPSSAAAKLPAIAAAMSPGSTGWALPGHPVSLAGLTKPAEVTSHDDSGSDSEEATSAASEDASIRGNTPTALPMVDLSVASRRQRGLFSYASR